MSNATKNTQKLRLQAAAFLLIALPSFGLFVAVASGSTVATCLLFALIAGAMILAATAS